MVIAATVLFVMTLITGFVTVRLFCLPCSGFSHADWQGGEADRASPFNTFDDDDSTFDDNDSDSDYPMGRFNPANGLLMLPYSSLDIQGNSFGMSSWNESSSCFDDFGSGSNSGCGFHDW